MRPLGITMKGGNGSSGLVNTSSNLTMAELVYKWNVWETHTMVFLSFMLQLFLLATGSLRRLKINGVLKAFIWLAYVGADLVAVYALGLFSQYEEKYKLGRESFGDTLPFLWVPFLLVHMGGQDSITAFSIEDNNLWKRHLLNLATQGVLALYVFWKSFYRINYKILVLAMLMFVSGIIKYGERVWTLKSGSRNGLGQSAKLKSQDNNTRNNSVRRKESYALQTVLLARGLFVGRTVLQLGDGSKEKLVESFPSYAQAEEDKLKMVVMELGMMFDLLYTKANVLQRCTGFIFRCAAQILVVVAFVLFVLSEKHEHNRVNVSISYALFLGAIIMECTSVVMVISSPWTEAHLKEGSSWLVVGDNKMEQRWMLSNPIGQFNLMDWSISEKSTAATVMRKVMEALGMDQQWRNLWHIKQVEAKRIVEHIVKWFDGPPQQLFTAGLQFGSIRNRRRLNYTLSLPFEHALYRLHIYTDLHLSKYFAPDGSEAQPEDVRLLKEDCEKLSNYMIYLMAVYPSMLPVSTAAQDVGPKLPAWVRDECVNKTTKLEIMEEYATQKLPREEYSRSPFEPEEHHVDSDYLRQSLEEMREMWVRLLIYAAGKCPGELHARQLANGGELLTFVWLLMLHHGLGDVAAELSLVTSDDPFVPEVGSTVSAWNSNWIPRQQGPRYAFDFHRQAAETSDSAGVSLSRERERIQLARLVMGTYVPLISIAGNQIASLIQQDDGATGAPDGARYAFDFHRQAAETSASADQIRLPGFMLQVLRAGESVVQDEAGTSGKEAAGRDDDIVATPSEIIDDQVDKAAMPNHGSQHA